MARIAKTRNSEGAVMDEPSQAQLELAKAKEIIEPLAKAGKSDDEMAIALIQSGGFSFKKAGRLMKKCLEDLGVRMSAKDRYEMASELLLKQGFMPESWDIITKAAEWLATELDATDEKQALAAIKKFCNENEFELPEKPKGAGKVGAPKAGFRSLFLDYIEQNPRASDDDFDLWVAPFERKSSQTNYCKRIIAVVRKIAA